MRGKNIIVVVALLCAPLFVFAQDGSAGDGTTPADPKPADSGSAAQPAVPAPAEQVAPATSSTAAPAAGNTVRPTTTSPITPNPTTPGTSTTSNTNPTPQNPAPTNVINLGTTTLNAEVDGGGTNPLLWALVAAGAFALALVPFGFLPGGMLRRKPKGDEGSNNRCLDIKEMMEAKLRELTDVKAMAKEKMIEMSKEKMRDAVSGTATGDLLVRAQKLEEQFNKLKKLFEECQIDVDRYALKGVVVENSLLDKKILEHVRVIRTRTEGERVLHDIRLSPKQIDDIQTNMIDTKWFFHHWKPGTNDVTVVFKDKQFTVRHSDTNTWSEARAYGVAHGIPESQLDFRIE